MSPSHPPASARRRFLRAAGVSALAASPLAQVAFACSTARNVSVGVVIPRSLRHPELGRDFVDGFRIRAAAPTEGPTLQVVPMACGEGPAAALSVASAQCSSVDVLAVFADQSLAARLGATVDAHGVPVLACDLGADVARLRREVPNVARHSLGYWQAHYAFGSWAASNLGTRAVIAADFMDSGYDMIYAFRRAFEAVGGTVAALQVTSLPDGGGDLSRVAAAVRAHRPDFVYALYSGKRARAFLEAYRREGLAGNVPLAGPALLAGAESFEPITTISPWFAGIASTGNAAFIESARAIAGRDPSLFTVLGYEAAQRIAAGFAAAGADAFDAARVAREMQRAQYAGPRGAIAHDAALAESTAPSYVRHGGKVEPLPSMTLRDEDRRELRTMVKSGWARPYLSA